MRGYPPSALLDGTEEKRPTVGGKATYYRRKRATREGYRQHRPLGPFWTAARKETYYRRKRDILQRVPAAPSAWLFWMAARIWVVMLSTSCSMFLSATCFAKETYHRRKRDLL